MASPAFTATHKHIYKYSDFSGSAVLSAKVSRPCLDLRSCFLFFKAWKHMEADSSTLSHFFGGGAQGKPPWNKFSRPMALYRCLREIHNICLKITRKACGLSMRHKAVRQFSTYPSIFIHSCQLSSSNPDFVGMNSKAKKKRQNIDLFTGNHEHGDNLLAEILFNKTAHFITICNIHNNT